MRDEFGRFVAAGNKQLSGLGKGLRLPSMGGLAIPSLGGMGGLGGLGVALSVAEAAKGMIGVSSALLEATNKAADFNETLSKTETAYGPSAKLIIGMADEMGKKFGLVKGEMMDAASSFGLVLQAGGMSQEASAKTSARLTKLAADASSLQNVPLAEALTRIQSGLVGEAEPMRRFGVLLSEDDVKAEAFRMGLIKSTSAIDEQSKVAARVSLIFAGMAKTTGDLERTAGSAANQIRKFWGDIENAKIDLGKILIDPLVESISLVRDLGGEFSKLSKGLNGKDVTTNLMGFISRMRLAVQFHRDLMPGANGSTMTEAFGKELFKRAAGGGTPDQTPEEQKAAKEQYDKEQKDKKGVGVSKVGGKSCTTGDADGTVGFHV